MSVEAPTSPKLATFADIDGTLLPGFIIFPLLSTLAEDKIISAQNYDAAQKVFERHASGEIDYETFAVETLEAFNQSVRGKKDDQLSDALEDHLEEVEFYPWVRPTREDAQTLGKLVIVSAEPGVITRAVAHLFGADYLCSEFEQDADGVYTGAPFKALGSNQKKLEVSRTITALNPERVAVFGDSAGDAGMLELANPIYLATCITPDAILRDVADRTGMKIVDDPYVTGSLLKA